jgi:membrane protein DedA with SNARE-associated domain
MFLADLTWFLTGKIKFFSKMKKYKWIHASYKKAQEEIEATPNNSFLLILIKFAYGIAIPILMYLGRRKMTLKEFIIKNSIIIILWSSAIVIAGWLIGKTSAIAFSTFENIYASIILIVTGLILVHLIIRNIRKRIIFKTEHRIV